MIIPHDINPMILICAAGASTRMAPHDKLLLPIRGKPLLRHIADTALATKLPTTIALPSSPHPRWQALHGLDILRVTYTQSLEGLSGTLRAAVHGLPTNVTHLCVVLADLPNIQTVDFDNVFDAVARNPNSVIWRPTGPEGQPAHPTVFHSLTFGAFAKISGDTGAKDVIEKFETRTFKFLNKTNSGCMDIDCPADYKLFLKQ